MGVPDDIAAELPGRRPDEPESLRRDIVDELADHLGCAHLRELQRTGDEAHARRSVLAQFGNPSAIARRLWWDAMQEKIMSQRISTVASVIAAAACLGIFVVMWQTQAANRELLHATQAINAQLLQELQAVKTASDEAEGPAEWNRLQIRCVVDTEGGSPLEGVRIRLSSGSENTVGIPPTTLTSDANGLVDFGQVLYGQYYLTLTAPNGLRMSRDIAVRPGQDTLETIACPVGDGLAEMSIRPDLQNAAVPENLAERVWYRFSAMRVNFDSDWSRSTNPGEPEIVNWFVGPGRKLMAVDDLQPAEFEEGLADGDPLRGIARAAWALPEDSLTETIRVEPSWYNVGVAAVCIADASDPTGRTLLEILNPGDDDEDYARFPGQIQFDSLKVVIGMANESAIPVPGESISLVERVLEAAPEMVVATLPLSDVGRFAGRGGVQIDRIANDGPTLGNRVAIYDYRSFRIRSFNREVEAIEPYLTGVEVLIFRDLSSRRRSSEPPQLLQGGRVSGDADHELRVLLTPKEWEFFQSHETLLVATVVPDDTERSSLIVEDSEPDDSTDQ